MGYQLIALDTTIFAQPYVYMRLRGTPSTLPTIDQKLKTITRKSLELSDETTTH